MASITIRDLDPRVKEQLRVRAARHGWSMEEEARVILKAALAERSGPPIRLADSVRERFAALGGVNLELPERQEGRAPPRFR